MATTFELRLVGSSSNGTTSANVEMGCIWSLIAIGRVPLDALFQTIRTYQQAALGVESTLGIVTVLLGGWCTVSCAGCPGLIILLAAVLVGVPAPR
jgi:hypothetical protein